jgi:hypothetical protein
VVLPEVESSRQTPARSEPKPVLISNAELVWMTRERLDTSRARYPLTELAARTINVTDPDSRNLKTTRGWVQGYNAQAVVTGEQIIVAAEISTESLDTANLQPMVTAAEEELHAAGVLETPGVVLADAGYCKNSAIAALGRGHRDTGRARRRPPQAAAARPARRAL